MYKLIAFDLDNTLCPQGGSIDSESLALLRELSESGIQIAICSGKPSFYLCGFMRQVGLKDILLIGENGATIQYGVELPPKRFDVLPYPQEARDSIALMRREIDKAIPGMFYQPNVVGLTPFPASTKEFEIIDAIIERNRENLRGVDIYHQPDSFDIVPCGISKAKGLEMVIGPLKITPAEIIAVGDSSNDYPMFRYAGYTIGVNVPDAELVDENYKDTATMLRRVLEIVHES